VCGTNKTDGRWYPIVKGTKREEKGDRKSERPIIPEKRGNRTHRDPVEGRGRRMMEPLEGKMPGTSSSDSISTKLQRIAELARKSPGMVITTLAHHIDMEVLKAAYRRTRKDAAAGIDGQTAATYAENLEENLNSLLERLKTGSYKAPAVRRIYIPKADGRRKRAIGIPTFEDKVLQRAVAMVLEAVYEQDFHECSYGFRPGRSAHEALEALWQALMNINGGWVLEVDIQDFFDTLDHHQLHAILDQRVRDGVIRRAIGKWLKAGVLEDGQHHRSEQGTPQGGVVSPLLANIFLNEVMDRWFEETVRPRLRSDSRLFRFADDMVIVFIRKEDAQKVLEVLPKRFEKYGLRLHPEKTRLFKFQKPGSGGNASPPYGGRWPETFDFLGFRHYWGLSKRRLWVVKRKTATDRFSKAVKAVALWCKRNRDLKISVQHKMLCRKIQGHYQYYGITFNADALNRFLFAVRRVWAKWLSRRSHRSSLTWETFNHLLQDYPLPRPRVVHSAISRAAKP
jgi:group II intron reverse transcriptase/maturase